MYHISIIHTLDWVPKVVYKVLFTWPTTFSSNLCYANVFLISLVVDIDEKGGKIFDVQNVAVAQKY